MTDAALRKAVAEAIHQARLLYDCGPNHPEWDALSADERRGVGEMADYAIRATAQAQLAAFSHPLSPVRRWWRDRGVIGL